MITMRQRIRRTTWRTKRFGRKIAQMIGWWGLASIVLSVIAIATRGFVSYINSVAHVLVIWSLVAAALYIIIRLSRKG
jgi:hypothetical protein